LADLGTSGGGRGVGGQQTGSPSVVPGVGGDFGGTTWVLLKGNCQDEDSFCLVDLFLLL